jgi:hypothetical protein
VLKIPGFTDKIPKYFEPGIFLKWLTNRLNLWWSLKFPIIGNSIARACRYLGRGDRNFSKSFEAHGKGDALVGGIGD